jgi:hypothetical protein
VDNSAGPKWSSDVAQADWIRAHLTPWGDDVLAVTSVIPAGFERYARVLHPVDEPAEDDGRPVRWADMAAWSGLPLRADAQFHSVALPPGPRPSPPPSTSQPREGDLYLPDAEVLAAVLRDWTDTPEDCWFCVWDGYGWDNHPRLAIFTDDGEPPAEIPDTLPDPVPQPVRDGARVQLPYRDYLLYHGPVEAVAAIGALTGCEQSPNLWWPADRAWCVATEIDLQWTYVGGASALIDALLADGRIEVLPARPDDPVTRVEDWVAAWVERLADALLADGEAELTTSRGTVRAWLSRPGRPGTSDTSGEMNLRTETSGTAGSRSSSSWGRLGPPDQEELHDEITHYLTSAVTGLAGL